MFDDLRCKTCGMPSEPDIWRLVPQGALQDWCDWCTSHRETPKLDGKLVQKHCEACSEPFKYVARVQRNRFYCDPCRSSTERSRRKRSRQRSEKAGNSTRYELVCAQCEAPFVAKTPIAKCCSAKCKNDKKWADQPFRHYVCDECGNGFESKQHKASVCSDTCHRARNSRISKAIAAEKFEPRPEHVCQHPKCGKAFVPYRPGGAQLKRGAAWAKYCSRRCADAARTLPPEQRLKDKHICANPECGAEFRGTRKYCSPACRPVRPKAAKLPPKPPVVRRCAECDEPFSTIRPARFCSKAHAKRYAQRVHRLKNKVNRRQREVKRKRLIRARTTESVDPRRVFQRDKWRCQLCFRTTPKRLRGSYHLRAPELDHIVSVAAGGDHSYANAQCSCRDCNLWKGDRYIRPRPSIERQMIVMWRMLTFG